LKEYANLEVQEFIRETTFIDLGINSVDFINNKIEENK